MKKFIWFKWKWVPGGFWGLQLRINTQNSKIQYGGSNMTVENVKIYLIGEFSKSLIANLCLTFRNSKWRIQYGELKYKKLLDSDENRYYAVFQVAECGLNDWTSTTVDSFTVHGHQNLPKHILSLSIHKNLSKFLSLDSRPQSVPHWIRHFEF